MQIYIIQFNLSKKNQADENPPGLQRTIRYAPNALKATVTKVK